MRKKEKKEEKEEVIAGAAMADSGSSSTKSRKKARLATSEVHTTNSFDAIEAFVANLNSSKKVLITSLLTDITHLFLTVTR